MIVINYNGRLGNILFVSIGTSIIAKKYNLKVSNYTTPGPLAQAGGRTHDPLILTDRIIETLGLTYFSGDRVLNNLTELNDDNFFNCLENFEQYKNTGFTINCASFQVEGFVRNYRNEILSHFKNLKYSNVSKDDLLVNVRLGDMTHTLNRYVPDINYYENCIQQINYKNGYIITDSPEHNIVKTLINKYNLKYFTGTAAEQILFAKDFNNLVLSSGTFAWWIGVLSKAETIYYPITPSPWTGNIHVFPEWKGIKF